jgi:tol-pal system protein YbgF
MQKRSLLLILSSIVILGCAANMKSIENETLLPEIDVVQVKENSDQALKLAQELKLDVEALSSKVNENDNKISLLADDVSSVSAAKIEEIENRMALLIEAVKDLQIQIKALGNVSLHAVKKTSAVPADATFSPSEVQQSSQKKISNSKSPVVETVTKSQTEALLESSEDELYSTGLRTWNSHNYKEAIVIFNNVLQKFPNGIYGGNANFWIGESYFALGEYASAVKAYDKVFAFKGSSKIDASMYKIGITYIKMGQQVLAKQQLTNLITRYPSSDYTSKAKKILDEMK